MEKGTAGVCGVRFNREGTLIALSYGLVSSIALDPVEKKPLYMFHPGKYILSVGGFGCNLKCGFCQNHEISTEGARCEVFGRRAAPEEIAEYAAATVAQGNIGVAYTYNEPLIGYEFLCDCSALVRSAGLKNVLVTNGYINPEPLLTLLPLIDAMNIDLKGFSDSFYRSVGGKLQPILETIERAHEFCHVEVTTLVIPGENDNDIEGIAEWISKVDTGIPLHLTRFFPRYLYGDREPTPRVTLERLRDTAGKYLNNVFIGNI